MKTSPHIKLQKFNFCNLVNKRLVRSLTLCMAFLALTSSLKAVELRITDDTFFPALSIERPNIAQKLDLGGILGSRVYMKFDLSSLAPPASGITLYTNAIFKATLRIYYTVSVSRLSTGRKISSSLDDTSSYWDENSTVLPLASGVNTIRSSFTNTFGKGQFVDFDVTPIVRKWLTGEMPNNGFVIMPDPDPTIKIDINSKESNQGNPPTLHIAFSPEPQLPVTPIVQLSVTDFPVSVSAPTLVSFNPTADIDSTGDHDGSVPYRWKQKQGGITAFNVTVKWNTLGLSGAPNDSLRVDLVKINAAGTQVIASDITKPNGDVTYSRLNIMQKANAGDDFAVQVTQNASGAAPITVDAVLSTQIIGILSAM